MSEQPKADEPRSERAGCDAVNATTRYDVYCQEQKHDVVYRNARFKGRKTLFRKGEHDVLAEFIELEQEDGQTVFIARSSVVKFCPHGVKPDCERSPW